MQQLTLSGTVSHISRVGYVYLPPQYYLPAYRAVRFPVLELLHGTPGTPANWLIQLRVPHLMDKLIAAHEMGPMVLVMPAINPLTNGHWQECTDGPRGLDDTYLSTDVPTIIRARYRVSTRPSGMGFAGLFLWRVLRRESRAAPSSQVRCGGNPGRLLPSEGRSGRSGARWQTGS